MSTTRYDFDGNADGYFDDPFMKVREKGKFVLHSDYAALEAKYNALVGAARPIVDDWKKKHETCVDVATDMELGCVVATFEQLDELATLVGEEK